MQANKET